MKMKKMLAAMIFMAGIIPQLHAVTVTNDTELPISIRFHSGIRGSNRSYRLSPGEKTDDSERFASMAAEYTAMNTIFTHGSVSKKLSCLKLTDSAALQASYDITYDPTNRSMVATKTADTGRVYNNKTVYPIKFKYKVKKHSNSHSVSTGVSESYTAKDKMKYIEICFDIKDSSEVTADTGDFSVTYKNGALFLSPVMYASINPVTLIPQIIEETADREDYKTSEENVNNQRFGYQDGYEDGFADGLSEANYSDDDGPVYNAPRRAVNADDDSSGRNYQDGYEDGHADGLSEEASQPIEATSDVQQAPKDNEAEMKAKIRKSVESRRQTKREAKFGDDSEKLNRAPSEEGQAKMDARIEKIFQREMAKRQSKSAGGVSDENKSNTQTSDNK